MLKHHEVDPKFGTDLTVISVALNFSQLDGGAPVFVLAFVFSIPTSGCSVPLE